LGPSISCLFPCLSLSFCFCVQFSSWEFFHVFSISCHLELACIMVEISHYWRSCDRNLVSRFMFDINPIDCHKLMKSVGMLC
jgi:hypothetical protein